MRLVLSFVCLLTLFCSCSQVQNLRGKNSLLEDAKLALAKAVRFFRTEVAVNGSYVWTYSADLKRRRGESEASETEGWVQPPGTPSVGMAYLRAYEATGDKTYLEAAIETAKALTETQLASGGWDYRIDFHPERHKLWFYRKDIEKGEREPKGRRNLSIYDDDNTQSALRFLMSLDAILKGKNREIRRSVEYGLAKLIEAQYPNGAWPQRYDGVPPDPKNFPIMPARYPKDWSRTHPGKGYEYWRLYTLNDRVAGTIIQTLLDAYRIYGNQEYLKAAKKGGDFLILAQMPEPQPAWAQQYNFQMEPAWARRFEPPAIAAAESSNAVRTLIDLYIVTGDEKYLRPIPKALEWFKRSQLPNGQWARFYELRTNRPIYVNEDYEIVYEPKNLREDYAFEGEFGIPRLFKNFERLKREGRKKFLAERNPNLTPEELKERAKELEPKVRQIIASLDEKGRWLDGNNINTRTFVRNVETLAAYISAVSGKAR